MSAPTNPKPFTQFGVRLDGDSIGHAQRCTACATFDDRRPATAALCCLEGSVLLKRENTRTAPKRQRPARGAHWAPAAEIKRRTLYK